MALPCGHDEKFLEDHPVHTVCAQCRWEKAGGRDAEIATLRERLAVVERERDLECKLKGEALYQAELEAARAESAEGKLESLREKARAVTSVLVPTHTNVGVECWAYQATWPVSVNNPIDALRAELAKESDDG